MSRPILAVDVDGVISLFGFDEPPDRTVARFELIDGMGHDYPPQLWARWVDLVTEHAVAALPGHTAP